MSFDFQNFVKKSTRGLFIFIIATMVLPLVLWGYMSSDPAQPEEEEGQAGTIFGSVKVSKADYRRQLERAAASIWWERFEPIPTQYLQYMRRLEPPTKAQIEEKAWEALVLLHEAGVNGIVVTEREVLLKLREVYQKFTGSYEYKEDVMARIAADILQLRGASVNAWAEQHLRVKKLLDLVSESEFADYDGVYGQVASGAKVARAWVAEVAAGDARKHLRPVTTDEVAAQYRKSRDKYKVPQKVQVSYLMAEYEPLEKEAAEPAADEVKKYYDEHKAEFAKEHAHKEGEEHKDDEKPEYKSFDEVKSEIPGKIRKKAAEKRAAELMAKVDVELGRLVDAKTGKYPDDAFDKLKAQFAAQKVVLVHDITLAFDRRRVEEVEKTVGSNSNLAAWAFETGTATGDISRVTKTSKGALLFRLNRKIEPLDPGITDRVREVIVKEVQKEQLKRRIQKEGERLVQEINASGFAAARKKLPLEWRLTRYFKVGTMDMGLEDYALSNAVNRQVSGGTLAAGKAAVVAASEVRGRDKDGSIIVYLEDASPGQSESSDTQFSDTRKRQNVEARQKFKDAYVKELLQTAAVQKDASISGQK
jgi:hypothetical protein